MSMQLRFDEALCALREANHPAFSGMEAAACAMLERMAALLAGDSTDPVWIGSAELDYPDFAGLCVPLRPTAPDQMLPPALALDWLDVQGWEEAPVMNGAEPEGVA